MVEIKAQRKGQVARFKVGIPELSHSNCQPEAAVWVHSGCYRPQGIIDCLGVTLKTRLFVLNCSGGH
jgi:hypothetical protein